MNTGEYDVWPAGRRSGRLDDFASLDIQCKKRKRRTNGDIADVMLEKENLLSMSHNAMIPLPFLTASTEAEIMCIVDVKGNIRERSLIWRHYLHNKELLTTTL